MSVLARLALEIFNRPTMIHPQKAELIVASLADRLGVTRIAARAPAMFALSDAQLAQSVGDGDNDLDDVGYDLVNGIAIVPISGTLVHRFGHLRPYSGMTGYDAIRQAVLHAATHPDVRAIVLDIDSPGGVVAGVFDLADEIAGLRGVKPIWAILDDCAFSAAYALASACDFVTVPRTGGVGSVGVVCMHVDYSQAIEAEGLKVTFVQYGAHKTDGNEFEPLEGDALRQIQNDVNAVGELFVQTVARNRKTSVARVRATQAACFMGQDGVKIGFADAVMAPDQAFRELLKQL